MSKNKHARVTRRYEIDYQFGTAWLWSDCDTDLAINRFYELANQCFGIRKSIGDARLLGSCPEGIPEPWNFMRGAYEVLRHSGGDTIVWNEAGEKIKDEFA